MTKEELLNQRINVQYNGILYTAKITGFLFNKSPILEFDKYSLAVGYNKLVNCIRDNIPYEVNIQLIQF